MLASWIVQLRDQLRVASGSIKQYDGTQHPKTQHAFILLLNRATENVGALLCLFENGWENDAMSLVRTLADIYIDVNYLRAVPEQLERFLDFSIVSSMWKKEEVCKLYGRKVDDSIREDYAQAKLNNFVRANIESADEYVTSYRAEVAAAQTRWNFKHSGWAKHDARTKSRLIVKMGMPGSKDAELVYDLVYSMASEALHSGIGGALRSVTFSEGVASLHHEARKPQPRALLVLTFASFMFMKVLDVVNDELSLGVDLELQQIDARYLNLLGPQQSSHAACGSVDQR